MSTSATRAATTNPPERPGREKRWLSGSAIVAYVASVKLIAHLATASVYGFFIDELYFLACGQHLAWGYVDMPPLTAFQAWLTRTLFGNSAYSIRLFPSLALGGKRFAQFLAAFSILVAPVYLAFDSYLSMNSIEPLVWMGCALLIIKMIQTGNFRLWLWFGGLAGIGLLNKDTMLMFGFALVFGLLLTMERRILWNRWILIGGGIALLLLELLANIRRNGRDVSFGPLQFLSMQIQLMHPLSLPIWGAGLWGFFRGRNRKYRCLGWAYVISLAVLLVTHGKTYYLAPAYPMLLAAGALALESWSARTRWRILRAAYCAVLGITGAMLAPTIFPILQPRTYLDYTHALGISQPKLENRATNAMPQFFADRFGWPEMVVTVAKIYNALPAPERAKTAIIGNDFGQCGAIDFYGPRYGLPKSIGTHLTYWYWGPRDYTGEIAIVLGDTVQGASQWFGSVEEVAEVGHVYAMKQEHFKILLCRHPQNGMTLQDVWPHIKNFN